MNLALYIGGMGSREQNFHNDYAVRMGYEEEAARIQNLFLAGKKAEAAAAVPDQRVDDIHLLGPADRIRDRLSAWREAGTRRWVDTMQIMAPQKESLELFAEELL